MTGPEGDLSVSFVETSVADQSPEDIALSAWKLLDPGFESAVLRSVSVPPQDGWDEMHQVVYVVPASESRMELAVLQRLGSRAFVNLVRGSNAAMGRRGAQINEIVKSWRPEGLHEVRLQDVAAPWTVQVAEEWKAFILSAMERMNVPGVSVAVVQNGTVVFAEGFGVREVGKADPVTPGTRFMIGSTTKPLTTLLMAKLVEQGKVEWSTPVVELLPEFALADPSVTARLELRHTASASTGMPRQDVEWLFRYTGVTPEDRIAQMKTMRPTTGFGETFQYSNYLVAAGGYAAGCAFHRGVPLEDAYREAMTELIFEPLGMRDSFVRQTDAVQGEHAKPHAASFEGDTRAIPLQMEKSVESMAPAGGVWSTALDLAQYLKMELALGHLPGGEKYLTEQTLLERRQKGVKIDGTSSYGLGLMISEESGLKIVHHGGNTLGFSSDLFFLPDSGVGVAVLTNQYAANAFVMAVRQKLFELLYGAPQKAQQMVDSAVKLMADGLALLREKVTADAEGIAWAGDVVGRYHCAELGSAEISMQGARCFIQFEEWGGGLGFEEQPGGDRLLRVLSPPWRGALRLLVQAGGKELILDQAQNKYLFVRQA